MTPTITPHPLLRGAFCRARRRRVDRTGRKTEHPLDRISAIEARNGELDYHYNDAEYLLRVSWTR